MTETLDVTPPAGGPATAPAGDVSPGTLQALVGTQGWVRLVGIVLFIGAAFTALAAVLMLFTGSTIGMRIFGRAGGGIIVFALAYALMAILYGVMGNFLVNYAAAIARLAKNGQRAELEQALDAQRKFWKLAGILVLIMLALVVLGILAAIAIPLMMALR